jgi:RimJ/RimL family protein N-acetyltransferase
MAIQLRELDVPAIALAATWLSDRDNYRWLDFGSDVQAVSPLALRMMTQRPIHCLRLFTDDVGREPIGIVGLSNVSQLTRSASLWYVLGDKLHSGRGCTARAVRLLLNYAFGPMQLRSINAWAVEENVPSVRVLQKNGFHLIGRQRQCHNLDGRFVDRLLFDLLASEHCPIPCMTTAST